MMNENLSWTDIEDLGLELAEAHPRVDPARVKFTELRTMIEALPGFEPLPGQNPNEQILEAVQAAWIEEAADLAEDDEDEDDERKYRPNDPFR